MPASVITRALAITYGGVKVGTGTNYHLTNIHQFSQSYAETSVTFDVLVQDDTAGTFVTQCNALEAAYRTPNSDLKIELGASTHIDYTQSGNTGMNGVPAIAKLDEGSSNNSRVYRCSVTVQMPADETGKAGRQSSTVSLTADAAGIQTLRVEATYTGLGASSAQTQAAAQFPTYAEGLQPAGTWDESESLSYVYDDEDKVCTATVGYRQLIHNQSSAGANDTSLIGEQITVTVQRSTAQADTGSGAKSMVQVTLQFSTAVLASSSTDLKGKWEGIRSYLVTVAQNQSGVSPLTVVSEDPNPEPSNNRLNGTLTMIGSGGSSLIRAETSVSTVQTTGEVLVPVANGDAFARDLHLAPQSRRLVVVSRILELDNGTALAAGTFRALEDVVKKAKSAGYREVETGVPSDKRFEHLGLGFSAPLRLRARQKRVVMEFARIASTAGGSGVTRTRGAAGSASSTNTFLS